MLLIPGVSPAQENAPAELAGDVPPDAPPAPARLEVAGGALDPSAVRFTPPPPPKPPPSIIAEASAVIRKPTHTITLVRGEPSALPDIPPPTERVRQPATVSFPPRRPGFLLGLSVTVYDRALSHLKWRDPQTKEELEAWCGWDWSLLAPMQEVSGERVAYNLFFSPRNVDTARRDAFGGRQAVPGHPPVGAGEFALVRGGADAPAGKPFLEAVQRYCVANRSALEEMRAAREQFRADAEAWKMANPTRPMNHTIALRPHRGSRYLKGRNPAGESAGASNEEGAR